MKKLIRWLSRTNRRVGVALLVLTVLVAGIAMAQDAMQPPTPAGDSEVVEAGNFMEKVGAFIAAALATGLGSIAAGMAVSNVGSAAMGAVAERPELMGKSLIYVALAEGIAIYGLLVSIIILAKV